MIKKEIWMTSKKYGEFYEFSNLGRYRSTKKRIGGYKEKTILTPKKMKDGYLMFRISFEGKQYLKTAHRIIGELFIENKNNLPQINHKDSNRSNNCVENLEWVTPKQNIRHAIEKGNFKNSLKNLSK